MPYKFETQKKLIPRNLDKRVKLSLEQREQVKNLYGLVSQRELAKMFDVSRRNVIFIGCPEKLKHNLELRKERIKKTPYYNKEKNRVYILNHRQRKKFLNDSNKLLNWKARERCKIIG